MWASEAPSVITITERGTCSGSVSIKEKEVRILR